MRVRPHSRSGMCMHPSLGAPAGWGNHQPHARARPHSQSCMCLRLRPGGPCRLGLLGAEAAGRMCGCVHSGDLVHLQNLMRAGIDVNAVRCIPASERGIFRLSTASLCTLANLTMRCTALEERSLYHSPDAWQKQSSASKGCNRR